MSARAQTEGSILARRIALRVCAVALLGVGGLLPCGPVAAAPVVHLTSPTAGETLADPVVISATASNDVIGVQFWLDGVKLGPEIPGPRPEGVPYAMTWNPWTVSTGQYTIKAVARDAANQTAQSNLVPISVFATPHQASAFAAKPLPVVRGRLGLMPRDYWWGGTPSSTGVGTGYLPYDRDPLAIHDLHWFETHHPDWLVYTCDGQPLRYFTDAQLVLDITNPGVREYQYRVFVRYHMKRGSNGISIDNFFLRNIWGKCGVYQQGVWRQKYSGELDDPQYVDDAIAWLTWMSDRVHADGGLVALNTVEPFHPDLDRAASKVDLVYFEGGGFINTQCRNAWSDEWWLRKFQVYRKIALERGLAVQDETCDYMSQVTPEMASWDVANFLLVRGDRSYFSMTQSYVWRPLTDPDYDGPELHAPLGEALGEPQQYGVVWMRVYQYGLVVVNPSSWNSGAISLGAQAFHDVHGRLFTDDVTVPPASGLVLLAGRPPGTFADVPPGHWAHPGIEALGTAGVTAGCGGHNFCPDSPVSRAEMAVFLLRAKYGAAFAPLPARGAFADVPVSYWAASWIERLAEEGISAGCGAGRYCPETAVTRAQMAVFLVRAMSSGYVPPAASGIFGDVPATYWAGASIEQIARDAITAGCGGGRFCPESVVSRAEMAVFLTRAFGLGP